MPFDDTSRRTVDEIAIAIIDTMMELLATRHQWCKGIAHKKRSDGVHAYCLHGAHQAAMPYTSSPQMSALNRAAACRVYQRMLTLTKCNVVDFNDSKETHHRHIMTFLTRLRASFAEGVQ